MPRLTLLAGLLLCSGLLHAAPTVSQLQDGLEHPWSLAFLPAEQGLLITERPGRLRLWQQGKGLSPPIAGVPQVYAEGQGGLLEVLPAPDFAASRRVYLSFAEPGEGGKAGTAVGYGRLSEDARAAGKLQGDLPPVAQAVGRQSLRRQAGVRPAGLPVYRAGRKQPAPTRRRPTSCRASWCG